MGSFVLVCLTLIVLLASTECYAFRDHSLINKNIISRSHTLRPLPISTRLTSASGASIEVPPPKENKLWTTYVKVTDTLTTLFPLWTVLFAGLALTRPQSFDWFGTKYFTASLGNFATLKINC